MYATVHIAGTRRHSHQAPAKYPRPAYRDLIFQRLRQHSAQARPGPSIQYRRQVDQAAPTLGVLKRGNATQAPYQLAPDGTDRMSDRPTDTAPRVNTHSRPPTLASANACTSNSNAPVTAAAPAPVPTSPPLRDSNDTTPRTSPTSDNRDANDARSSSASTWRTSTWAPARHISAAPAHRLGITITGCRRDQQPDTVKIASSAGANRTPGAAITPALDRGLFPATSPPRRQLRQHTRPHSDNPSSPSSRARTNASTSSRSTASQNRDSSGLAPDAPVFAGKVSAVADSQYRRRWKA